MRARVRVRVRVWVSVHEAAREEPVEGDVREGGGLRVALVRDRARVRVKRLG